MKTAIFLIALFCLVIPVRAQEIQPGTQPDKTQRELLKRGYGMFIHYGMNTFLDKDWSEGVEPASTYHPTQLDCDQWVRIAREAGFRYVVLVTKHHDGFCLYRLRCSFLPCTYRHHRCCRQSLQKIRTTVRTLLFPVGQTRTFVQRG